MPRRPNELIRLNLYFQPQVMEGLKRIARAKGTNVSELVRQACREYVLRVGGELVLESTTMKELTKP
jgi:hypothetical protein